MQSYSVTDLFSGKILFQAPLEATAQILHLDPKQVDDLVHSTIVLDQHWDHLMPADSAVWPGKQLRISRLPLEIPVPGYSRSEISTNFLRRQAD